MVVVNPFGPHHCTTCCGSVHAAQTSSRGASNRREITISRSLALFSFWLADMVLLLLSLNFLWLNFFLLLRFLPPLNPVLVPGVGTLDVAQVLVEPVEALRPEALVVRHPLGHFFETCRLEPARTPLRLPP